MEIADSDTEWSYGPYRFLLRHLPCEIKNFWKGYLESVSDSAKTILISGSNASFIAIQELPWESQLFNKKMGSIVCLLSEPDPISRSEAASTLVTEAVRAAKGLSWDFLMAKVYTDDFPLIFALEQARFSLVDTVLDYVCQPNLSPIQTEHSLPYVVRSAHHQDQVDVVNLYSLAFANHFGRFHADPVLSKLNPTKAYRQWAYAAFSGFADKIIVAEDVQGIIGASFWKNPSTLEQKHQLGMAHYSIGAVHPRASGLGVFTEITRAGVAQFQDLRFIEGPTHINNYGVQRGYERLNWRIEDARHTFHLWLK